MEIVRANSQYLKLKYLEMMKFFYTHIPSSISGARCIVIENKVVGICCLLDSNIICNVFIKKEYRGKGYGKQVIGTLVEEIFKRKNEVELCCSVDNKKAFSLYSNLGFITYETFEGHYFMTKVKGSLWE